jgi:hypothetical protein
MPKFEVTIERRVPCYRERATVVVVADSVEDIEDNFDMELLDEIELDWEEVMEGHGGFPCDYDIQSVNAVDDSVPADIDMDSDDTKEN